MTRRLRVSMILAAAIALVGCRAGTGAPAGASTEEAAQTPEQQARLQNTIGAWLECDDCSREQLEALRQLGSAAVPTLSATLREGPPRSARDLHRDHLRTTYQDMRAFAASHPDAPRLTLSEEEYVDLYGQNYAMLYRTRAAEGLGAIGTPEARAALTQALQEELPPQVRSAVQSSLANMNQGR